MTKQDNAYFEKEVLFQLASLNEHDCSSNKSHEFYVQNALCQLAAGGTFDNGLDLRKKYLARCCLSASHGRKQQVDVFLVFCP